ncbi:hypothetical protein AB0B25_26445 [Nocardia sp. NPDC049190]
MRFAAGDASVAKDHRGDDFEMSRFQHAELSVQVHGEWIAVWDRLLD